ncbi:MAG: DUF3341 domain-containing protein [Acidobacteria bacterium]|nr:DUF3341 domain-containing protein [Acidobacteriota bacterium]
MIGEKTTLFGICPDALRAHAAIRDLLDAGVAADTISVLLPDGGDSKEFVNESRMPMPSGKEPNGAETGVAVGGAVGAALGLAAGLGALSIPGIGPFLAAGPFLGALTGFGIGGTLGGLLGAMVGVGIPEHLARRYEARLRDGAVMIAVHCINSSEAIRARDVMRGSGVEDVALTRDKVGPPSDPANLAHHPPPSHKVL